MATLPSPIKLFSLPARRNLKQKLQEHRLRQMRTMTFSTQWKIHFQLYQRKLGLQLLKKHELLLCAIASFDTLQILHIFLIEFHPVVFCSCIRLHPFEMISLCCDLDIFGPCLDAPIHSWQVPQNALRKSRRPEVKEVHQMGDGCHGEKLCKTSDQFATSRK